MCRLPLPLLLPLLALVSACAPGADVGPPIEVVATDRQTRDAIVAGSTRLGLTRLDAEGRVIPGLAQSWRGSDDGSFIIFRLRPALARGGRAVVAQDVVAALSAARGARADLAIRPLLAGVREVRAPLPEVVELRLSTPQPEMLEILALPALAVTPARSGRRGGVDVPGPFRLAPADGPDAIGLEREPDYFAADQVMVAGARVRLLAPEEAVLAFQRGEADLVFGGYLAGLGAARVAGGREALLLSRARAVLALVPAPDSEALKDPRVRQALALAIDRRRALRAGAGSDDLTPLERLTPTGLSGYPAPVPSGWAAIEPAERPAAALRLLDEAHRAGVEPDAPPEAPTGPETRTEARPDARAEGVDPRPRLALSVERPTSVEERRLLEAIAADWKAIGVDLRFARAGEGDLRLRIIDSPVDSPLPFLAALSCTVPQAASCQPEADRLVQESFEELTLAGRMEKLAEAERIHLEAASVLPIGEPLRWMLVSRRIGGVVANRAGIHPLALLRRERT